MFLFCKFNKAVYADGCLKGMVGGGVTVMEVVLQLWRWCCICGSGVTAVVVVVVTVVTGGGVTGFLAMPGE